MAWLVAVNLDAVARRLSRARTHHVDELEAAAHLSCTHAGVPSPFRQTSKWGWFYTDVDPALLLEPSEIELQLTVSYHAKPEDIDPAALGE